MIILEAVHKVYPALIGAADPVVALDDVNLVVSRGEIHGIVGPPGAGKSTAIRLAAMLEHPTGGRVLFDRVDIAALPDRLAWAARKRIGLLDGVSLLPSRTVAQAVAHPLAVAGVSLGRCRRRVDALLELVGLSGIGELYPDQLLPGERQRVGLARALVTEPDVLVADDVTAAAPPADSAGLLALIADIRDRTGLTVVLAGEDMVAPVCDSVTWLDGGRVREPGRPAPAARAVEARSPRVPAASDRALRRELAINGAS